MTPKPTAVQVRQMMRDNLKYPHELVLIPPHEWPRDYPRLSQSFVVAVWRSRKFTLFVWNQGGVTRLSVQRNEWDERQGRFREDISWDDLQRLKREAGYGDACAVELFPPDEHIVNVANMRHLFITPEPIFMWR